MSASDAPASNPATPLWVAGFDAALPTLDQADHIGGHIHDEAIALGISPDRLWIGTHILQGAPGLPNRVALSVAVDLAPAAGADPAPPASRVAECVDMIRRVLLAESGAHDVAEIGQALPGAEPTGLGMLADGAARARTERAEQTGGRAIAFPGEDALTGDLSVGELIACSAIDEVVHLGHPHRAVAGDDEVIHTREFVRPMWAGGILELPVTPWDDTRIVPFEDPNPKECCVWHG